MESALLKIYETFEDAFGREKARIFAENLAELIQKKNDDLATRNSLKETELKLTREIKDIEVRLAREIKDIEVRLAREINSAKLWTITAIGIIIGILKGLDYVLK